MEDLLTNDFTYVDLNEVDPSFKPITEGVYTLKVLKAEKKAKPSGGNYLKFTLAICNDPNFTGRRLFPALFFSEYNKFVLRRIMDATGVAQEPGTTLDAWLTKLSEVQPEFKSKVLQHEDRKFQKGDKNIPTGEPRSTRPDGTVPPVNSVDWKEIHPA